MAEYFRELAWQDRRFSVRCSRKKAKCLRLRVLSGGRIRLTIPYWADEADAGRFLASKAEWIARAMDSMSKAAGDGRILAGPDGMPSKVRLRGKWVDVSGDPSSRGVCQQAGGIALGTMGLRGPSDAEARLYGWLREEARSDFDGACDRYRPLLERMGCKRPEIVVRDMRSLWGSCRPKKGSITMNLRLIHESPLFASYVMLHEIAHLRHPGHGADFAAFMDENMPDWKVLRKRTGFPAAGNEKGTDNM